MKPSKQFHQHHAFRARDEKVEQNRRYYSPPPPLPPSTNPTSPSSATPLQQTLRHLLRAADVSQDKAILLDIPSQPNLLPSLQTAVADVNLRTQVAQLFASLSVDHDAAKLLSEEPYLPLIDRLLTATPPHPVVRLTASIVRNITAHSTSLAHTLARNSSIVRRLIVLIKYPSQSDADTAEIAAALANFSRAGLQCQAYARKHGAVPVLVAVALSQGDATRFHSCRALAEYSLEPKWLVLLVGEGCVNLMIQVLERDSDVEIISEATRFLGNMATSKIGREAILGSGGVERVVTRLVTLTDNPQLLDLRIDLLRTTANLCVNSKESAFKVINLGGLATFVGAYTTVNQPRIQTEAFRGLLIIAQATHAARAAVLRDIGIKIRHDASRGRCVASLYDLLRRIKIEASVEKDDLPQTIADLGARSKQYLFRAGPLATQHEDGDPSNSVPKIMSPAEGQFRQSGRLLSVQRPTLHRHRHEQEKRERAAPVDQLLRRDTSNVPSDRPQKRQMSNKSSKNSPRAHGDRGVISDSNPQSDQLVDPIPRCRVIEASKRSESAAQWVKAVWSAVCNAVSKNANRPENLPIISSEGNPNAAGVDTPGSDQEEDVYEIGMVLGRGGFATVSLARNLRTGDLVAVKRFHPPSAASRDARRKAEISLKRAIKEQRIWDGLAHKNIVSYKGCFYGVQGELNLVAEYIPGWSLADHLSQITRFPEHMVACITLQVVAGLDYLHKCGVTHRDVKPANILVDPHGVIKITDFGVSSAVDVPTMTGNTLVGTPWYIAPEMIEGRPYGQSVDIWSLGCTVIELATGKRPYHHLRPHIAMFRMTQDRMPPIPKSITPVLRNFLKTCWVWDPAQRPTPAQLKRHPFLASVSCPEVTNLRNIARPTP